MTHPYPLTNLREPSVFLQGARLPLLSTTRDRAEWIVDDAFYQIGDSFEREFLRRWLDEVANARVHATTKAVPAVRLAEERAVMLAAPALEAPTPIPPRVALPIESLQHPLSVYDALLEVA